MRRFFQAHRLLMLGIVAGVGALTGAGITVAQIGQTPIPTTTPTATVTVTPTPTASATAVPSPTNLATARPTSTATATTSATPTRTATATATPVPAATATMTAAQPRPTPIRQPETIQYKPGPTCAQRGLPSGPGSGCYEPAPPTTQSPVRHGPLLLVPSGYVGSVTVDRLVYEGLPQVYSRDITELRRSPLYHEPQFLPSGFSLSAGESFGEWGYEAVYVGPNNASIRITRALQKQDPQIVLMGSPPSSSVLSQADVIGGEPVVISVQVPGTLPSNLFRDGTVVHLVKDGIYTIVLSSGVDKSTTVKVAESLW